MFVTIKNAQAWSLAFNLDIIIYQKLFTVNRSYAFKIDCSKVYFFRKIIMEYKVFLLSFIFLCRLTCAFLACKVDEFNVSSPQFVGNLRESPLGQERALEQILEYELLLIQQLNFHLIVHNPYRPFEGFLIDIKVNLLIGN